LRAEFEAYRAQQPARRQQELAAIGEFVADRTDEIVSRFEEDSRRLRAAIFDAVEKRFADLELKVRATERTKDFQFARERDRDDEPIDLPNILPARRLDS
jgi:hypothetical protein